MAVHLIGIFCIDGSGNILLQPIVILESIIERINLRLCSIGYIVIIEHVCRKVIVHNLITILTLCVISDHGAKVDRSKRLTICQVRMMGCKGETWFVAVIIVRRKTITERVGSYGLRKIGIMHEAKILPSHN